MNRQTNRKHWNVWSVAIALAALLGVVGCGEDPNQHLDVGKLEKSFASAEAGLKHDITDAVAAIKTNNFAAALPLLDDAYKRNDLSPDQKWALSDALSKVAVKAQESKRKTGGS